MRLALLSLALLAAGCASSSPVTLDRYRGVYSTHFDGIPDQVGICAVLTNRGETPLGWVRLRLRSFSQLGEVPGKWTSHWLYARRLAPGESVVVEFRDPPHADQIELSVAGAGGGRPARRGRPLVEAHACSEARLQVKLEGALRDRTAPGVQIIPVVRRTEPSPEG